MRRVFRKGNMAYLIIIKSNKIPKYFSYMNNEPGCAKSMKEYVK